MATAVATRLSKVYKFMSSTNTQVYISLTVTEYCIIKLGHASHEKILLPQQKYVEQRWAINMDVSIKYQLQSC